MNEVESRLARLEENGWFLEKQLKELDQQLVAQQAQLDVLAKKLEQVQMAVRNIQEIIADSRKQPEPPPPHHEPKLW